MSNQANSMGQTSIAVSEEIADRLFERKRRGETYDDVIRRLLAENNGNNHGSGSQE